MSEDVTPAPPGGPLSPAELEQLANAIVGAYSQTPDLTNRLWYKWGVRLDEWVNVDRPRRTLVADLLKWSEDQGRTRELAGLLWSGRQTNDDLRAVARHLLGPLDPVAARYAAAWEQAPPPPIAVDEAALQKVITDRSPLVDYVDFVARLGVIGRAVCRIETGVEQGTGFLIGPRTVLTNYHVVKQAIASGAAGEAIMCRFDYLRAADGADTDGHAVPLQAGDGWLRASSPFSESDVTGVGDPAEGELDYAVLRLAAPFGPERAPLILPETPRAVAPLDIVMIVQHAGGDPLRLALGAVVEFPASGRRYRYNVTTKSGSSGAPVLSAALDLIALHHAADPAKNPRFNQAVPAARISAALKAAGQLGEIV